MEGYKNQNITEGEASETDSDEEPVIREIKNITPLKIVEQKVNNILKSNLKRKYDDKIYTIYNSMPNEST
jgi:hypothetical protein